jgi:hypothetical protein
MDSYDAALAELRTMEMVERLATPHSRSEDEPAGAETRWFTGYLSGGFCDWLKLLI